ncbi:MAG: PIN domain-containing protein [Nitrospiraceae bacterium]|nr:PIN domain-containing protein [Nitrospiraceae bacterium]
MRVLVDTSVWSLALRRKDGHDNKEAGALKKLIEQGEDISLLGIILQEILQGIKRADQFQALRRYFEPFPLIELSRDEYIKAAALKNDLIKKGIQASTVDALIASAAINKECVLFTTDSDFFHIAKHVKLKLLRGL